MPQTTATPAINHVAISKRYVISSNVILRVKYDVKRQQTIIQMMQLMIQIFLLSSNIFSSLSFTMCDNKRKL